MKTYIRPLAEIKEFVVVEKIANLDQWLTENSADTGIEMDVKKHIASYNLAS